MCSTLEHDSYHSRSNTRVLWVYACNLLEAQSCGRVSRPFAIHIFTLDCIQTNISSSRLSRCCCRREVSPLSAAKSVRPRCPHSPCPRAKGHWQQPSKGKLKVQQVVAKGCGQHGIHLAISHEPWATSHEPRAMGHALWMQFHVTSIAINKRRECHARGSERESKRQSRNGERLHRRAGARLADLSEINCWCLTMTSTTVSTVHTKAFKRINKKNKKKKAKVPNIEYPEVSSSSIYSW